MNNFIRKLCITRMLLVAGLASAIAAAPTVVAAAKDDIPIGVILPLSGEMGLNGAVVYDAYEIAAQVVNDGGGVNGKKVRLVKGDSPDPAAAQQNARNMIQNNVRIAMGSLANNIGLPASAVMERSGGTYFETTAVSEEFTTRGFKHVFRASTPGAQMGSTAIHFAAKFAGPKMGIQPKDFTVGILYEPNWQLIANAAKETAQSYGMKVAVFTDYDAKSLDFSSLITQLKTAKVDLVLAGGWLNDSTLLNKQSKQLGFSPKVWVGLSGGHSIKDYAETLGANSNGVYVVNASSDVSDAGLTAAGKALKQEFLKRWAQKHPGDVPGGLAYEAFGNAYVLMHEALPKAKSLSPADVRNALLAVDLPEGSLPNGCGAKFGPDGANQRTFYTVLQWQDKGLYTVYPDKFGTKKAIVASQAQ